MKYVVILADGMADYIVEELGNKTPLQYAKTNNFDYLASKGEVGLVNTIPEGMPPGSDTANLAVMGYNPKLYYTGRSPFEAASMGIDLKDTDVTFRCNVVTLSEAENYKDRIMLDHSADEITTEEAAILIEDLKKELETEEMKLYAGVSYRHLLVWDKAPSDYKLIPPHDIIGRKIEEYLPTGKDSKVLLEMMEKSVDILEKHPINLDRIKRGLKPANSIWIWGEGKKPLLTKFHEKYGLKGAVISAVDLIKGIGKCADLEVIEVEGATGNVHTNYTGKAKAALEALNKGKDFVYIHIEAPDECGHRNERDNKVKSIELIDEKIAGFLIQELDKASEDYKIMVLPDHPTPLTLRTHTSDPVPFLIYDSRKEIANPYNFDEDGAAKSGLFFQDGCKLMDYFIGE
ncbi:MAG: cofactor-independent phosphoglycerate mutase [Clostridiales bacterium]|uniref:cofactor-independent phosphoglycerate mutase n=1 Tax=Clostridium sp. N3C TaxID=1776758 RepID=UPI00092E18BD|nr:cofactor-independent phosphoglycerate mutase [Clostridium sp. N3C]NLZ49000.1 cofactor-independent phosphoglycerate mutase [Clostridiales bacterium]SCN23282.1 cofactor-independent phosphoglycerate mutase [Clostridium sp. N3C]